MEMVWEITLLGKYELCSHDRIVDRFPRQKVALLLAYLALNPHRFHPRDLLAEMLWQESSAEMRRLNLRSALHTLRQLLEPDNSAAGTVLIADRNQIRLRSGAVSIDADMFVTALRYASESRDPQVKAALLCEALRYYRGELLPGYYADWVIAERDRLQEIHQKASQQLQQLQQTHEAIPDIEAVIDATLAAIRNDPADSAALCDVMRLYCVTGRSHIALEQYQWSVQALESVGKRPTSAMLRLASEIRAHEICAIPSEAPPSHPTQEGGAGRLTHYLTRFFGREEEIAQLREFLSDHRIRLITLTGMGGAGKTRLAVETAEANTSLFPGGIWFVSLAGLSDAAYLLETIAETMRPAGIAAQDFLSGTLTERIRKTIGQQRALLILDSLEHLLPNAADVLHSLLLKIEFLTCLVTSRHIVALEGEHEIHVAPFAPPEPLEPLESLLKRPCVQMYLDRTRSVRPAFRITASNRMDVAHLCARLEGIPLVIELAAAWSRTLSPGEIGKQLAVRLETLISHTHDVPARHLTLRATMQWSVNMLPPELRSFFLGLSIFRGGWTIDAAEAVCAQPTALEYLTRLRERSLILVDINDGSDTQNTRNRGVTRFRMLEMLREYAWDEISDEDRATLEKRHADYYLEFALAQSPSLNSPAQFEAVSSIRADLNNLRAALTWFRSHKEYDAELRLLGALWYFWCLDGDLGEGAARLAEALTLSTDTIAPPDRARAKALHGAGTLANHRGDYHIARRFHQASLEILRALNDEVGAAIALASLGNVAVNLQDYDTGYACFRAALEVFDATGEIRSVVATRNNMGIIALCLGDIATAQADFTAALALRERAPDQRVIGFALTGLGTVARENGERGRARALHTEAIRLFWDAEDRQGIAAVLDDFGALAADSGDYLTAILLFAASDSLRTAIGASRSICERKQYTRFFELAIKSLLPEQLTQAIKRGSAFTVEEAVSAALTVDLCPPEISKLTLE